MHDRIKALLTVYLEGLGLDRPDEELDGLTEAVLNVTDQRTVHIIEHQRYDQDNYPFREYTDEGLYWLTLDACQRACDKRNAGAKKTDEGWSEPLELELALPPENVR